MTLTDRAILAGRSALPLMDAEDRAEAERLIAELNATANTDAPTLTDFKQRAAATFQADMQPVCSALASALHAGDLAALRGLRALLPTLLRDVNRQPALADLLAHQLGQAVLEGMQAQPEVAS